MPRWLLLCLLGWSTLGWAGSRDLGDRLAELAAQAVPAVVVVQVDRRHVVSPELQELVQELGHPQAWEGSGKGEATGSGVIVSAAGRVITNAHVVLGAARVTVVLSNQLRLPARVVRTDPRTDIAVLQIEGGEPHRFLSLGDSEAVRVGDVVLTIGNPFEFQSTVTLGIVSAIGRRGLNEREIQDYIQTDAAVNPGSSGGPMIDLDGHVIGINTAIFAPDADQNAGISFAIPAALVARVVGELDRQGRVPRSWVGLVTRTVSEVDGDPTKAGAEVLRVIPDSPAERAGLRRGDIVVEVSGEPTPSEWALRTLVWVQEVGSTLEVHLTRDGQPMTMRVVTGEERDIGVGLADLPEDAVFWSGLYLAEPDDDLRAHFGVGQDRGVIVARVDPDSPAERLGLKTGDLVLEVAGDAVQSLDSLRELLAARDERTLVLAIQRGGGRSYAVLPR